MFNSKLIQNMLLLLFSHEVLSDSLQPHNCSTPCFLCFTISWSLPKFMSIVMKMPSNHFLLHHPLLFLSSVSPRISLFQWVHLCSKWSKYWSSLSASVLPVNIQNWFPLKLPGLIFFAVKGTCRVFSSTTTWKHQFSVLSLFYGPTLTSIHDCWKNHSFD